MDQTLKCSLGTRFEQREPPTEDKVVQINLGDEANPKPIFISESLSPSEKKDLISLVREYIDVFAWNYEDIPGLDPRVAMHRLNINTDVKPVKQQQRRSYSTLPPVKAVKVFQSLSHCRLSKTLKGVLLTLKKDKILIGPNNV